MTKQTKNMPSDTLAESNPVLLKKRRDFLKPRIYLSLNVRIAIYLLLFIILVTSGLLLVANELTIASGAKDAQLIKIVMTTLSGLSFLAALYVAFRFYKLMSEAIIIKNKYEKKLAQMMNEYNRIIIESKVIPDFSKTKLYALRTFEELLNVQNMRQKPIIYMKVHNEKSMFIVSDGEECYRYIMKAVDLEGK